jgi:hypothetical protein
MRIPTHYRNVNRHPRPQATNAALIAPNMQSEVQRTINEHPEIDTMNEEERGAVIDITDWRVNYNLDRPWGRKARSNDPNNPNLNTDGMTFLRSDGLFEIYDCISGIDGQSSWEGYGPYAPGENGYWHPPMPVDDASGGGTQPDYSDLEARVTELEKTVSDLATNVETIGSSVESLGLEMSNLAASVATIQHQIAQPLHCHGPVDLPIVLESISSLRAKGDINVAVKPGEAVPPPESSTNGPAHPLALWRWLQNRRSDDAEEGGS